ncbi:hypothetical protein L198_04099 [Cryptococcus wingfieldii CBS 7118]|uniref:Major facilitator superfamily (MFS) profile domain-containing protein n=1 Tax=Cryptococcus wingfieldii CBS 7118 TaxID=1295528 RepID=A0A1E3J6T2_9TREE|nr:hypothetical protein L198_04099 [Cryptococcus wingfieldii CBS 7118]ODN96385.1 hypothetical protein L198_04099 [Cryptococcus wingfieldii CBS 7118]
MSNQPVHVDAQVEGGLQHVSSRRSQQGSLQKCHYIFKRLSRVLPLPSRRLSRVMLAVLFLVMFLLVIPELGGMTPRKAHYYRLWKNITMRVDAVDYLVISIIWILNFVGFMTSGLTNVFLTDRLGFGIAAPLGASMQGLAYILMCWGSPYPLFLIAYIFNGFGLGLQDAQVNSLTARLPNAPTKMFLMHALYGFGATISPFVATAFVQHIPDRVYLYFTVSLGLAVLTAALVLGVFRLRTEDQIVGSRQEEVEEKKEVSPTETVQEDGPPVKKINQDSGSKMKRILKTPVVHYMAFYMVIYVGVEVTIGGWATTFLIDERGGDSNAGYVSAGYFGGLTLGRVIFIPVSKRLGPHLSIWTYTIASIVLSLIIWFTHTIVGNAVCFALVGVFLGPMYPLVMNVVTEVLPGELQGGTIGWIASLGQAGSAMMPFITGAIAEKYGVWILQPLSIAFLAASLVLWMFVVRVSQPDRPFWHIPRAVTSRHEKEKRDEDVGERVALDEVKRPTEIGDDSLHGSR